MIPPRLRLSLPCVPLAPCWEPRFLTRYRRLCRRAEAPVEYKTISIVRCDKLSAALLSRATSSTQDLRQATCGLAILRIIEQVAPVRVFTKKKPQGRHMQADGPRAHPPLAEQILYVGKWL